MPGVLQYSRRVEDGGMGLRRYLVGYADAIVVEGVGAVDDAYFYGPGLHVSQRGPHVCAQDDPFLKFAP